jgi:flagellar assembly factor FliW
MQSTSVLSSASGAVPAADSGSGLPEITFIRPIPGFVGLKRFVLTSLDETGSPISELRSLERPEIRFVVAMPGVFFSDYAIELDDQDCDTLGLEEEADALILTVLTLGKDAASTTANLLAPMVINARTRDAAQVILTGSDWPVRAPLG